jgi:hypothetical protein
MDHRAWLRVVTVLAGSVLALPAAAQPQPEPAPADTAPTEPAPAEAPPPATEPEPAEPAATPEELMQRIDDLEQRLQMSEQARKPKFPLKITGYGDLGFFATQGDGAGFRRDAGHTMFPSRADFAWVFYGDLLATAVNSRGDVADLGDAPGVDRFDSVHSRGNPTFLVNELNLSVNAGLGPRALFTSSVNFTPRTGKDFALGDSFDVDVAQVEWLPTESGKTSVFAGKVDSVIGIEYKTRKAPARFGITPSLLARYTVGTAVGLKARTKLYDDHLVLSAAITNGSFGTEQFHFFDEVDTNAFKTVSGRAALKLPVGKGTLEIGPSGQWGTQDGAPDGAGAMWFVGVDAELEVGRYDIKAQWLKGKAPGDEVSMTYALDLKSGGYLEGDVILTPIVGVLGRAEFRDAEVRQGMERLYITKNWRGTVGVRLIFNPNAIVKAEYSHNGEYGGVPGIPDDVVTTSAVMAF